MSAMHTTPLASQSLHEDPDRASDSIPLGALIALCTVVPFVIVLIIIFTLSLRHRRCQRSQTHEFDGISLSSSVDYRPRVGLVGRDETITNFMQEGNYEMNSIRFTLVNNPSWLERDISGVILFSDAGYWNKYFWARLSRKPVTEEGDVDKLLRAIWTKRWAV